MCMINNQNNVFFYFNVLIRNNSTHEIEQDIIIKAGVIIMVFKIYLILFKFIRLFYSYFRYMNFSM